uniref:Putative ovule protein n=1 Tax=Solanum chacoense TaxID=4108 RepID=A0A0V0I4B0_SOLCH
MIPFPLSFFLAKTTTKQPPNNIQTNPQNPNSTTPLFRFYSITTTNTSKTNRATSFELTPAASQTNISSGEEFQTSMNRIQ